MSTRPVWNMNQDEAVSNFINYTNVEEDSRFHGVDMIFMPVFQYPINISGKKIYINSVAALVSYQLLMAPPHSQYHLSAFENPMDNVVVVQTLLDRRLWRSVNDVVQNDHACFILTHATMGSRVKQLLGETNDHKHVKNICNSPKSGSKGFDDETLNYIYGHGSFVYTFSKEHNLTSTSREFFLVIMWLRFVTDIYDHAYLAYINFLAKRKEWRELKLFMSTKTIPIILIGNVRAVHFWRFTLSAFDDVHLPQDLGALLEDYITLQNMNELCRTAMLEAAAYWSTQLTYIYRCNDLENMCNNITATGNFKCPDRIRHSGWWKRNKWNYTSGGSIYEHTDANRSPDELWRNVWAHYIFRRPTKGESKSSQTPVRRHLPR